jgi:uncharacterized protein YigA (DUF484 family)
MNRAESVAPAKAAAEAVKAYLRIHRGRIAEDPELLALLLPERFGDRPNVSDYQHFVIEKLAAENAALKTECEGLRRITGRAGLMREGVRRLVLALLDARSLEDTIAVATGAAEALIADLVSLGMEDDSPLALDAPTAYRLPRGVVDQLIEHDAAGALLKGNAHAMLFPGIPPLQSVVIFRLRIGPLSPPALYAVGARDADRFDDEAETREIAYFVRALERTIRLWLDPPKS